VRHRLIDDCTRGQPVLEMKSARSNGVPKVSKYFGAIQLIDT